MKPPSPVPSTMWTQIIEVFQNGDTDAAQRALTEFCERYHAPITAYFRQRGCTQEDAEDYTQEFIQDDILARMEAGQTLLHRAQRRPNRKFRAFLFTALRNFHHDKIRERLAQVRGGGAAHVPAEEQELSDASEEARRIMRHFDRAFAGETFRKAAERSVRAPYFLAFLLNEMDQKTAAAKLGMSPEAFRQRLFHFKKQLRADLREEVRKQVGPEPAEVEEEIHYLLSLFAEGGP